MIPCAPYIKSMCQSFRPLLPGSQEATPQGSPVKKDSAVRVSDVKGNSSSVVDVIESFNDNVSVYVPDSDPPRSTDVADVAKTLATFKPESPDVTRAAKRFEKARRSEERIDVVEEVEGELVVSTLCDIVEDVKKEKEEEKVEKEEKEREERRAEEEKRGARSKTTER